ncbi:hypothetical protein [Bacillus sp. P14.5]|nr:hypothetical protein [Bacillus sp. P14.5]
MGTSSGVSRKDDVSKQPTWVHDVKSPGEIMSPSSQLGYMM